MAKSQESYNKKEKEKKRKKKREEKLAKRQERKENSQKGAGLDEMLVYVDDFGNFTDTPPDPSEKVEVEAEEIELGVPPNEKEDLTGERKGKVDFFNDEKGYGFILDTTNQEKYFFHISETVEELGAGDKVVYELEMGQKGLNAVRVKRA